MAAAACSVMTVRVLFGGDVTICAMLWKNNDMWRRGDGGARKHGNRIVMA